MDLSIVIPAFREERKIRADVETAGEFLAEAQLTGEILVVDDGSPDDTAGAARAARVPPGVRVQVIRHETNHGKGCAVRTGMVASQGDIAMFADSGLCIHYYYALWGMDLIRCGQCEIAHATRKRPDSDIKRPQNLYRRIGSKLFHSLVRLVGVPGWITDSQCGFKIYRGDIARELYGRCITMGFMFDVEIILRALKKGYRIIEFPVRWYNDRDTRLRPLHTAWRIVKELAAIRRAVGKIPPRVEE